MVDSMSTECAGLSPPRLTATGQCFVNHGQNWHLTTTSWEVLHTLTLVSHGGGDIQGLPSEESKAEI